MVQVWSSSGSIKMTMIITTRMLLIHLIIIMITRIQLGIECVRGPRKFQLMITTVTRMLGNKDDALEDDDDSGSVGKSVKCDI